jgi:hypothetical protein
LVDDALENAYPLLQLGDLPRLLRIALAAIGDAGGDALSSICARLLTQTIPTIIMKGANGASQNPSISNISPQRDLSAQAFDLGRQRAVVGHVVALDLGEPAVDVAEPGTDLARSTRRALADALPVLLLVAVDIELRRLLVQRQSGDEVERDDRRRWS